MSAIISSSLRPSSQPPAALRIAFFCRSMGLSLSDAVAHCGRPPDRDISIIASISPLMLRWLLAARVRSSANVASGMLRNVKLLICVLRSKVILLWCAYYIKISSIRFVQSSRKIRRAGYELVVSAVALRFHERRRGAGVPSTDIPNSTKLVRPKFYCLEGCGWGGGIRFWRFPNF